MPSALAWTWTRHSTSCETWPGPHPSPVRPGLSLRQRLRQPHGRDCGQGTAAATWRCGGAPPARPGPGSRREMAAFLPCWLAIYTVPLPWPVWPPTCHPTCSRRPCLPLAASPATRPVPLPWPAWPPHLPPDLQPEVFAHAAAAVDAIADDSVRSEILRGLVPNLPKEMLDWAVDASPIMSSDVLLAILKKAQTAFQDDASTIVGLLRRGLDQTTRHVCLSTIGAAAPAIAQFGGTAAILECAEAVSDVHHWWP